ncbi:protein bunched, class 2/F/G isoform isoform X1 [Bradysia coprophila]|uniref:protein bunched, class 2/F/G isoform isoform X1 n=1 Tax=Bradysia coprophila TaxID=38358 RepID=UPI00187DBF7F|nr:protein bunched, class 2/F/G isoform isoform X1 [Bradysia coprophila]
MADGNNAISTNNLPLPQQQPTKLGSRSIDGKISKHGNVIHRTTSESLRLGGGNGDQLVGPPSTKNTNSSAARNAKTSSFQITSVTTAINLRTPADNGDDSADDLDESHTDDNSRITDHENETPSISEDTFSKEDVFFSSHAIGSAPVIPTSSQYGLAIVAPNVGGLDGQMISDVHVSVTDGGLNIVGCSGKHDVDMKDMNHRNERFKVVKIESTEPFKRGRWMCMDYLDHTTMQPTNPSGDGNNENNVDFENPNVDSPNKIVQTEIHLANLNANLMPGQSAAGGYPLSASTSPGQTLSQPLNPSSLLGATASIASDAANNPSSHASPSTLPNPTVQSMSSQQVSPVVPQSNAVHQPTSNSQSSLQHQDSLAGNVNSLPMQDVQQIPNMQQQQQQQPQQVQSQPTQFHGGGSQQQQQQQQQHPQHHQHQGQTLPASVLHNITNSHPNPSHVTSQPHQAMSMGHMSQSPQLINQPNFTQSQPLQPIATIINPTQSQQPIGIQTQIQQQVSIASPVPQSQANVQQVSQPNYSPSTGNVATGVLIPSSANVSNSVPNVINGNLGNGIASAVNVNVDEGASGISSGYLSPAGAAGSVSTNVGDVSGTQSVDSMIEGPNQSSTTTASTGSSGTGTTEDGAPTEDSESITRTKNVLTSNTDLTPPLSHYAKNQRISRSNPPLSESTSEKSAKTIPQAESNVFTKLALGNCMETLMKTSRQSLPKKLFSVTRIDDSSGPSSSMGASIPHKSVQNLKREESIGIPIPPRRDNMDRYSSFMISPPSGRYSPNSLMCGSPTMASSPVQGGYLDVYGSSGSGKVSRAASPQPISVNVGGATGCGDYSASGTSAVAIDNKIEQAMDLVKSHLMFAVREEVEVLKEKIAELMDRINQLEFENNILKANATQETLTQLSTIAPPKPLQNPNPANGPVS